MFPRTGAFLRYWLPLTPAAAPEPSLADIGFAYFLAFREAGAEMRLLPSEWISDRPHQMFIGRWAEFSNYATTVVTAQFVNVVLGRSSVIYEQKYTAAAFTPNVAIAALLPDDALLPALKPYQAVWAHSEKDRAILEAQGISSVVVPPDLLHVKGALDDLKRLSSVR